MRAVPANDGPALLRVLLPIDLGILADNLKSTALGSAFRSDGSDDRVAVVFHCLGNLPFL